MRDMTPEESHRSASQMQDILDGMKHFNMFGGPGPNRAQRRRNIRGTTIKKGPKKIYRPIEGSEGTTL